MVSCRGICSSVIIVILLILCLVFFVLHSVLFVTRYLDGIGTKESVKRIEQTSQRVPAIVICNRQPFSSDGVSGVNGGLRTDNTMRYLREWTNPIALDYPEYTPATSASNTEAYNAINSNLPQSTRRSTMQQRMIYQCQSVINSCTFNGNSYSGYQCCNAVSLFVPTLNGLCWTYLDPTMIVTSNVTYGQFTMTFTISRNSWYNNEMTTHPGIDIYLRETVDDVLRLASDLEPPARVTIRDKQGVRLKVTKQNRVDARRFECGTSASIAADVDTTARTNRRANMLMCVMSVAMTQCNCHPLLAEILTYDTNSYSAFSQRVNSTTVCTLDQYDQCARRYVETARVANMDTPIPTNLAGVSELQNCRRDNVFPCLRTVYAADPEPYPLPSSFTSSNDYVSRLTIDFASLDSFEVLVEKSVSLYDLLSSIGWNIALWFAIGHIIWSFCAQIRDALCKPVRISPDHSVILSKSVPPSGSTPPSSQAPSSLVAPPPLPPPVLMAPPPPVTPPPPPSPPPQGDQATPPPIGDSPPNHRQDSDVTIEIQDK